MRVVAAILAVVLTASLALNYFLFRELRARSSTVSYLRSLNASLAQEIEVLRPFKRSSEEEGERKAVVEEISKIRQLPVKNSIRFSTMSREELQEYVKGELDKQYPGKEMDYLMRALVRFGFTERGFDLKKTIVDLYTEEVGGLYDNDDDTLYMIEGATATGDMARAFLAHEVVHALQDQDLGLDALPLKERGDDDRVMACIALVEGDATVAMFQFYLSRMDAGTIADLAAATFADTKQYSDAPDFLKENLLFPYVHGAAFVSALFAEGGWKRVDDAYRDAPSSTEQILHPEKYLGERDEPRPVGLPDLDVFGWKKLQENALGEFNSRVLLKRRIALRDAEEASHGWGGDRFGLYESGDKEVLVWISEWDSDRDATEFHRCFQSFLVNSRGVEAAAAGAAGNAMTWSTEKETVFLGRRGREVLFISGSLGTDLSAIRNAFEQFKVEDVHEDTASG